ncbi:MAG: WXG100 family type VII secretion target [Anaerolineae bacterium]|jgi:WXG100 family type VII secretion target|nr:WXG100 family type VII secretion target [Chloroflexota bacterium]MBN8638961.1 WXG100 family type VII secretion target [Anaerolineae bacterium]
MSDLIRVPYTELLQRAARIRQETETIRAEIQRLRGTVDSIHWIGRRAERFFSVWGETVTEMEEWVTILEGFATELEQQARRMQIVDESF